MRDTDYEILEEIRRSLPQDKAQEFNEAWENLKEKVEEKAYMEGYFYAIQVLEESLKNKKIRRYQKTGMQRRNADEAILCILVKMIKESRFPLVGEHWLCL